MTHEYTILVRGRILAGGERPEAAGIGWAAGTVIALGSEAEMRAVSRGDSHFVDLAGAFVIPLARGADPGWPTNATLEIGAPADLVVLRDDPRRAGNTAWHLRALTIAVIRGGVVASGALPGPHDHLAPAEAQRG